MFKHVFKTMFIGVISSGLITTPVLSQTNNTVGLPTATSTGATSAPDKSSTLATSTTVTTDQDGRKGLSKTYDLDGVKSDDMIASITGIAVGAIGARMAMNYKPITTDVMIAAAGGAAFIAGELMSNMKAKGDLEKQTAEVQMKKGMAPNQEQIEYFQKLKKSYEEAKSATKTKKTMQMAASVAFGAAAAMATYMAFNEVAGDARCKAAMTMAATQYGTCAAASVTVVAASEAAACAACNVQLTAYQAFYTATEIKRQANAPTMTVASTDKPAQTKLFAGPCPAAGGGTAAGITAAVQSACASSTLLKQMQSPAGPPVTGSYLNNILFPQPKIVYSEFQSKENSSFDKLLDVFFPRAQAGWMPMFGLAGGALASYFLISGPLGIQIDSMMYVARNRAIVFAGLAGLSFMAAKSSDNQIKKLEGNIAKIDAILKEMLDYAKGVTTANTKPQQVQIQAVDPSKGINQLYTNDQKAKSPCLTSSGTDNCTSVEESITKSAGFGSLPPSMQALARETAGLGDSLSGKNGISGAALGKAESLGAKRGAVNGLLKKTQTKFNNASKGKKTDFDKEAGKFLGGMAATVKRSMQKNGISPGGMLASLGGHPMDASGLGKPLEDEKLTKGEAPVAGSIGSDGIAPEKKEDGENLNLDFAAAPELAEGAGAEGAAAAAEYDVSTNEIHGENGPSIFEVISSRYLKSGYSKLLEEEQPVKK